MTATLTRDGMVSAADYERVIELAELFRRRADELVQINDSLIDLLWLMLVRAGMSKQPGPRAPAVREPRCGSEGC